jgi:uncharacterized protein YhbP (UPF0306 family)
MNQFGFRDIQTVDVRGTSLERGRFSEARVRRSILETLESNLLFSMATVTPEGRAHINTAYFSFSSELQLYFLSHPGSRHCRNLSSNASMAATVFSSLHRWTDPGQGVQLFGTCEQSSGSTAEDAEQSYRQRFQAYDNWRAALRDDDLARQYRFYRFVVAEIKILDEQRFGDAVFVCASVVRQ